MMGGLWTGLGAAEMEMEDSGGFKINFGGRANTMY